MAANLRKPQTLNPAKIKAHTVTTIVQLQNSSDARIGCGIVTRSSDGCYRREGGGGWGRGLANCYSELVSRPLCTSAWVLCAVSLEVLTFVMVMKSEP